MCCGRNPLTPPCSRVPNVLPTVLGVPGRSKYATRNDCGMGFGEPWAGTETASEHAGYIEGAIESGERAAREVTTVRSHT